MDASVSVYKEKKRKDFRMMIIPTGDNEAGITMEKDYGIISYLDKDNVKKIGELVLWALEQSYEKVSKVNTEIKYEKKYSNCSSNRRFSKEYNYISFDYYQNKYSLMIWAKDGAGFGLFEDENNKYEFGEKKPTAYELGSKIMAMFEYKENYDEI